VQDLRIYRIRYVPVGQSTTINVKGTDPQCGDIFEYPLPCRTVRITGPPGAMVTVQASTNPSIGGSQLTLDAGSTTCCSLAATANVPGNGELRVYLENAYYSSASVTFTLTSAILP